MYIGLCMKFLKLKSHDPYYNLAVEEYIFNNSSDEVFILWQNEPCVVIGKNQNAYAEVKIDALKEKNIKLARRITGGGAVYHDLGNVNYTFISSERKDIDFAYFTSPIIQALNELCVKITLSGRNDLETVNGKKISGNAQRAERGRVLHHGTLLFNSDISMLEGVLNVDKEKLKAKSVRSVSSRVANISEYLKTPITVDEFIDFLSSHIISAYHPEIICEPVCDEIDALAIRNASDEWLYPQRDYLSLYNIIRKKRFDIGTVECCISLKNNIICDIKISGDFFEAKPILELEEKLKGKSILPLELNDICVSDYIYGLTSSELANLILDK